MPSLTFFVIVAATLTVASCFQTHSFYLQRAQQFIYSSWKSNKLYAESSIISQSSAVSDASQLVKADIYDSKLSLILETMTESEKYDILIQSYGANIMENSERNITVLKTMTSLFSEMLQKAIQPTERATRSLLDAASKFGSCEKIGRAIQLSKAGGIVRAYGVANGKLISPVVNVKNADFLPETPKDDRELEILYAGGLAGVFAAWSLLQALAVFDDELHSWATLLASAALAIGVADVTVRQSAGVKAALAGFDRLLLKDNSREAAGDSAAFVVGYLLGLPCFCFRPDVTEALKMFLDHRSSMEAYQQAALPPGRSKFGSTTVRAAPSSTQESSLLQSVMSAMRFGGGGSPGSSAPSLMLFSPPAADVEFDVFGVGRVLVWLMAPVAVEVLKYGKTISSDPKRAGRFLSVLDELLSQRADRDAAATASAGGDDSKRRAGSFSRGAQPVLTLPAPGPDRDALLRWAFFEATVIVQQNGDLLEDVRGYLQTGTASVGEVALLIENELRG